MDFLGRSFILRYVGSVMPEHHGGKGAIHSQQNNSDSLTSSNSSSELDFTEIYTIIAIVLSTVIPLLCFILGGVVARKLWVKYHEPTPAATEEESVQTSVKSRSEFGSSRKSSRGGSRANKEPTSRDHLLPQDSVIGTPTDDPMIIVADGASPSKEQLEVLSVSNLALDDDGGFSGARAKFRNHSLKSETEGSPHSSASHRRSFSDAGKGKRKSTDAQAEIVKEVEKQARTGNLLSAPNAKIRKSHSMRYRTDPSTGARPRVQAQDDCMGDLKRTTMDSDAVTSPRLQHRRSPHHFYHQQHQPQVHQQQHHSRSLTHGHHGHQSHQQSTQGHSQSQKIHSQSHLGHHQGHQVHSQIHQGHAQPHQVHPQGHQGHSQAHQGHSQSEQNTQIIHHLQGHQQTHQQPPQEISQHQVLHQPHYPTEEELEDLAAEIIAAEGPEAVVHALEKEGAIEGGNFTAATTDTNLEDTGTNNPGYPYGNQISPRPPQ